MKKSDLSPGEMYILKFSLLCRDAKYLNIFSGHVAAANLTIFLDFYDIRQQEWPQTPFYQSPAMCDTPLLAFASLLVKGQIIQAELRVGGLSNLNVSNHG